MKRGIAIIILTVFLTGIIYMEIRPYEIFYSSVFSSAEETEICLYVILNSFLTIDHEEMAKNLVREHKKVNGTRKNEVYELNLYRTDFHYKRNWKYDTLFCDGNGKIFENETY